MRQIGRSFLQWPQASPASSKLAALLCKGIACCEHGRNYRQSPPSGDRQDRQKVMFPLAMLFVYHIAEELRYSDDSRHGRSIGWGRRGLNP
jgi:hypothetical protein